MTDKYHDDLVAIYHLDNDDWSRYVYLYRDGHIVGVDKSDSHAGASNWVRESLESHGINQDLRFYKDKPHSEALYLNSMYINMNYL